MLYNQHYHLSGEFSSSSSPTELRSEDGSSGLLAQLVSVSSSISIDLEVGLSSCSSSHSGCFPFLFWDFCAFSFHASACAFCLAGHLNAVTWWLPHRFTFYAWPSLQNQYEYLINAPARKVLFLWNLHVSLVIIISDQTIGVGGKSQRPYTDTYNGNYSFMVSHVGMDAPGWPPKYFP